MGLSQGEGKGSNEMVGPVGSTIRRSPLKSHQVAEVTSLGLREEIVAQLNLYRPYSHLESLIRKFTMEAPVEDVPIDNVRETPPLPPCANKQEVSTKAQRC